MKRQLVSAMLAAALVAGTAGMTLVQPKTAHAMSVTIIDPTLTSHLTSMLDTDTQKVVLTYAAKPTVTDINALKALGITNATALQQLPMVITTLTKPQLLTLLNTALPNLQSIYADKQLQYFLDKSVAQIGAAKNRATPSMGFTGQGIGVAVVDSGIDGTHPDLQYGTRVVQNVKVVGEEAVSDYVPPTYLENVPDTDNGGGHGTHCAGIIGGDGTASGGLYAGVAPKANLIGVSSGAAIMITTALEGLDYVLTHQSQYNIKVVSNSWGTTGAYDPNDPINQATKTLHDHGITVVFAAGNDGPSADTQNPYSVAPWVISVAAGDKEKGTLADFSSRGIRGDNLVHPTITAPGVMIISDKAKESVLAPLSAQDDLNMIPTNYLPYYTTMSGTSMATPHIAGVVALLDQANASLTPDQIKQVLQDTATRMPGYDEFEVGKGYVNAYAAIDKVQHMDHAYGAVVNQTFNAKYTGSVDSIAPTNTAWSPTAPSSFTFNVADGAQVSDIKVAWDSPANLFSVKVTAPDGTATSYGANLLGAVYGTETDVELKAPQKGTWKVDVQGLKGLIGLPDTVHFSYRTYYGSFSGTNDVTSTTANAGAIHTAIQKRLIDSADSSNFQPDALISKGDLAHWIASDFEIRQNLTSPVAYSDVDASLAPYVAAVTADAAPMRDVFWKGGNAISSDSATTFGTTDNVNRAQLAVALVKALGLDDLAKQNMSTATTFTDDAQIPAYARGYVVVAAQKGLMNDYANSSLVEGAAPTYSFHPNENVTKGAFAADLVNSYTFFASNQ